LLSVEGTKKISPDFAEILGEEGIDLISDKSIVDGKQQMFE